MCLKCGIILTSSPVLQTARKNGKREKKGWYRMFKYNLIKTALLVQLLFQRKRGEPTLHVSRLDKGQPESLTRTRPLEIRSCEHLSSEPLQ